MRQEALRFEPLEENELKARTLGFKDFSETQSNLPLGAGLIECDKNRSALNQWKISARDDDSQRQLIWNGQRLNIRKSTRFKIMEASGWLASICSVPTLVFKRMNVEKIEVGTCKRRKVECIQSFSLKRLFG